MSAELDLMEGSGWDDAKALQDARWQANKEWCWRSFLRNAKRVLDAPEALRGAGPSVLAKVMFHVF